MYYTRLPRHSSSFVSHTINAWNVLMTSAFNGENVNGFERFLDGHDLSRFLCL